MTDRRDGEAESLSVDLTDRGRRSGKSLIQQVGVFLTFHVWSMTRRRCMQARILGAVLLAGLLAVSPARAGPTVNAGESVIFNFDLGAAGIAPGYDHLSVATERFDLTAPVTGTWEILSGLDGSGSSIYSTASGFDSVTLTDVGVLDGVFSFKLSVAGGSVDVNPGAQGVYGFGSDANFSAVVRPTLSTPPSPSVAEPASAGLALLALAAMAAIGRRRSPQPA
jgi:MYXO-CTERM domain-containing protein